MSKTKHTDKQEHTGRHPSKCACTNVRRASRAITKFYDTVMEPSGLKVTQFSVLRNILVSGPLNVSELAQILRLDRTTLVRNLKSLGARELIEDVRSTDARMRSLAITRKGKNLIEKAIPYWEQAQATIRTHLGSDNLETLVVLLMDLESLAD